MGAADVVPGVSGGTIALITEVYEELVNSLKSISLKSVKTLFSEGIGAFWKQINGTFLLSLFLGVFVSVFSLAKLMSLLLEKHPIMVWSFFLGLIIASAVLILKQIKKWNIQKILALIIGIAVAYFITVLSPTETPNTWWFVMLSGAIAICAMILPGISGAFILLILGKYAFVIDAIGNLDIFIIAIFGIGAVAGLLSFSNLLSYLLKHFYEFTIIVLSGFMIGSLNKVWAWKETVGALQKNISPQRYAELYNQSPQVGLAVLFALIGLAVIFLFEYFKNKKQKVS